MLNINAFNESSLIFMHSLIIIIGFMEGHPNLYGYIIYFYNNSFLFTIVVRVHSPALFRPTMPGLDLPMSMGKWQQGS